jgi:hypothetical protein
MARVGFRQLGAAPARADRAQVLRAIASGAGSTEWSGTSKVHDCRRAEDCWSVQPSLPVRRQHSPGLAGEGCIPGAEQPSSGAGQAEFDFASLVDFRQCVAFFFSQALGKASRAQHPHKTHRLIYPRSGTGPLTPSLMEVVITT